MKDDRKLLVFSARFTPEDHKLFEQVCERKGMSKTGFLRYAVYREADRMGLTGRRKR